MPRDRKKLLIFSAESQAKKYIQFLRSFNHSYFGPLFSFPHDKRGDWRSGLSAVNNYSDNLVTKIQKKMSRKIYNFSMVKVWVKSKLVNQT